MNNGLWERPVSGRISKTESPLYPKEKTDHRSLWGQPLFSLSTTFPTSVWWECRCPRVIRLSHCSEDRVWVSVHHHSEDLLLKVHRTRKISTALPRVVDSQHTPCICPVFPWSPSNFHVRVCPTYHDEHCHLGEVWIFCEYDICHFWEPGKHEMCCRNVLGLPFNSFPLSSLFVLISGLPETFLLLSGSIASSQTCSLSSSTSPSRPDNISLVFSISPFVCLFLFLLSDPLARIIHVV